MQPQDPLLPDSNAQRVLPPRLRLQRCQEPRVQPGAQPQLGACAEPRGRARGSMELGVPGPGGLLLMLLGLRGSIPIPRRVVGRPLCPRRFTLCPERRRVRERRSAGRELDSLCPAGALRGLASPCCSPAAHLPAPAPESTQPPLGTFLLPCGCPGEGELSPGSVGWGLHRGRGEGGQRVPAPLTAPLCV